MIVLDTHAWIFWVGGPGARALGQDARRAIDAASEIGVPAAAIIEVAWLVAHGRLVLDRDPVLWMDQALALPRVRLLPTTPRIAVEAARLDWAHRDPADRLIVATALVHGSVLVTADEIIRRYSGIRTVW